MAAPLNFRSNLMLYAMCAAAAYFAWPYIRDHFGPDMTSYSNPGPYGTSTGARNHTGIEPYGGDGHGGGRGYSDYFPGARDQGRPGYARQQPLHLDPTQQDDVEDRRGERRGGLDRLAPSWDQARRPETTGDAAGLRCRESRTGRDVPLAFCEGRR
jgi:hypothetical protein